MGEDHDQRGERLVIALGGNALIERDQPLDAAPQLRNVRRAVEAIAPLAKDHQLVITHGNGPQVGLLAIESSADPALDSPYPLDALVSETQGLIGYWLVQALKNALGEREVAAFVTQTLVSTHDPAFDLLSKFIGPVYTEARARKIVEERGWTVRQDGTGWRRVVASPEPQGVVEMELIRRLVDADTIVICAGGGGIAVAPDQKGQLQGVEAVVDKDLTSAHIAEAVGADMLMLLTDVAAVSTDFGDPLADVISRATPSDLRGRRFAAGSMGPKVDAICRFVERTGGTGAIGALVDVQRILAGTSGTIVTPSGVYPARLSIPDGY